MPDKKLTDNEIRNIKKRLKDIVEENELEYFHSNTMGWYAEIRLAYMAINSLQAENEKLKSSINGFRGYEDEIKAEAYKKFAELLFKKAERRNHNSEYHYVLAEDIVDLLKELVGDNNAETEKP